MDSPFPGMDPYLEQHWRSVHHRLITYLGDQLQAALPPSFRVEVEERVFVSGNTDAGRFISPDVFVTRRPTATATATKSAVATSEPIVIELADEPTREGYLEIIDTTSGEKVVTAIELLSPTNKIAGDGNDLYVKKQREYRAGRVNQVEIDLTRAGDRRLVFPLAQIPAQYRTVYFACVRRADQPLQIEAYPISLQHPLPTLKVPLGLAHADVPLNLQTAITACYRNGRYEDINYSNDLVPALDAPDANWVRELLRADTRGILDGT